MTNQKISWRQICINVLQNGPQDESENHIAANLINEGLADGAVRQYRTLQSDNEPPQVVWRGVTLKGLEYLDQLQDKLNRESTAYKVKTVLLNSSSFLLGVITTSLVQSLF